MLGASASSRSVTFSSLAASFSSDARLALLPLAVLVPDRPPAALLLAGRVHRDPALQFDHRAAAPGGRASGPAREDPAACHAADLRTPGTRQGPRERDRTR